MRAIRLFPLLREQRLHRPGDRLQHSLGVPQDVVVPEPDHPVTTGGQYLAAGDVSPASVSTVVLAAIEFDDQVQFHAREVREESTNGMLAAKAKPHELACAQLMPEPAFCVRLSAAQVAGE